MILRKFKKYKVLLLYFILLLAGLFLNKRLGHYAPAMWVILPVAIACILGRARYGENEKPVVRLWQLLGSFSAFYAVLHYPLMPPAHDNAYSTGLYGLLLFAWGLTIVSGVVCFRIPSLSILPPSFLLWSNSISGAITGLPTTIDLDVQPLAEVATCIGIGLSLVRAVPCWNKYVRRVDTRSSDEELNGFVNLLTLIAISVHLANYFWSFALKIWLKGPPGAWLTDNNPAYIFLAALDDGHILFSGCPWLVQWTYEFLDAMHVYSNFWVLVCQGAAITAFFLPKRLFFILLLMFDVMHASIILIVGANFWPWIILNVIITAVVASPRFRVQPLALRFIATGFILLAPWFVQVAKLGWFDSGANNNIYFEAVDDSGKRTKVSTNFFTFYSYSLGHMDYGTPDPETAFATGEPNGGAWDYQLFRAGRSCDVAALRRPGAYKWIDREKFSSFVRNYHKLALDIHSTIGDFPYNFYPHHFYVPRAESADFDRMDKHRIVAYIYKRDSVCLSFENGQLQRKVMATAEYPINVTGTGDAQSTR